MAYLPPHKRHPDSSSSSKPAPIPDSLVPHFKHYLSLTKPKPKSKRNNHGGGNIVYATNSISRWWPAGSGGEDSIPGSTGLEPFDCEAVERRNGAKPLVLRWGGGVEEERPWVRIAERILPDLVESVKGVKKGLELEPESGREEIKLSFVARMGKFCSWDHLFVHCRNSVSLEIIKKAAGAAETDSRSQLHKSFYTNVPSAYMDDIKHLVVPKAGFEFDLEKEHYHVKVFDKCQPGSTMSCKCILVKDNQELQIHKVELNQVRQLVADISCLPKELDLRLMLATKRILKSMDDEESDAIKKLVSSAVIDPDVKGGLRWPLGKESVADRFSIVGVWHTKYKAFKSNTMRLKLRHADRFDHKTSSGEVSTEVTLKLSEISKHLREDNLEDGSLGEMVEQAVGLIWNYFFNQYSPPGMNLAESSNCM